MAPSNLDVSGFKFADWIHVEQKKNNKKKETPSYFIPLLCFPLFAPNFDGQLVIEGVMRESEVWIGGEGSENVGGRYYCLICHSSDKRAYLNFYAYSVLCITLYTFRGSCGIRGTSLRQRSEDLYS